MGNAGSAAIWLRRFAAQGQRDATPCSLATSGGCNHSLTTMPDLVYPANNNTLLFAPTRPGVYTFRYEASDLCKTTGADVSVTARCPPSPLPIARIAKPVLLQGEAATLTSTGTKAGYSGASIQSYTWTALDVPAESSYYASQLSKATLGSTMSFTTQPLTISGDYKFALSVFDGCSSATTVVCFKVECACSPTANAGATSTVWTNTAASLNGGLTSTGNNLAGLVDSAAASGGGSAFRLDASLSYVAHIAHPYRTAWYSVRLGIPSRMVSGKARYPTRHGFWHGMESRAAWNSDRNGIPTGPVRPQVLFLDAEADLRLGLPGVAVGIPGCRVDDPVRVRRWRGLGELQGQSESRSPIRSV